MRRSSVVGAAFDVIMALQFQRDVVRPALGTFDKAVVEGGHESWGIYTKCRCERSVRFSPSLFGSLFKEGARGNLEGRYRQARSGFIFRVAKHSMAIRQSRTQCFFCAFSDAATALRNCSTAGTFGAFNAFFAVYRHSGVECCE